MDSKTSCTSSRKWLRKSEMSYGRNSRRSTDRILGNPFLNEEKLWQKQSHIYENPYYILTTACGNQCPSVQSMDEAGILRTWKSYMSFLMLSTSLFFTELEEGRAYESLWGRKPKKKLVERAGTKFPYRTLCEQYSIKNKGAVKIPLYYLIFTAFFYRKAWSFSIKKCILYECYVLFFFSCKPRPVSTLVTKKGYDLRVTSIYSHHTTIPIVIFVLMRMSSICQRALFWQEIWICDVFFRHIVQIQP